APWLALLVAAADQQGPALGEVGGGDEVMRLHGAPGRHVGPGRGVVGEDRDDLPDRHLTDPLGEHDDGDRALAAERVDGEQRGGRRREIYAWRPSLAPPVGTRLTVPRAMTAEPGSVRRRAVSEMPCECDTRPPPGVSTPP